ncbi:MAG: hypothetical protein HY073_04770 [Deltaproteobacteria bacterium]|nr:hypothetical protein [Deltaproteobacteria bacterium]
MVDEKILVRRKKGPHVLFSLNSHSQQYSFLLKLFELETGIHIASSSDHYHRRAKSVLQFSRSAQGVIQGARLWTSKNFSHRSFGKVPSLTVEDVIISKLFSLKNDESRFNDLDDLKSIFLAKRPLDLAYLAGQMSTLNLLIPEPIQELAPNALKLVSKKIKKGN